MTPEQWQKVETALSAPYGYATLLVDGYDLKLEVRQVAPLRLVIVPFVNGWSRGAWLIKSDAGEWCEEARRFLPLKKRRVWSSSEIKRIGKRIVKKYGMDKCIEYRTSFWTSFAALKRHLLANNESIEIKEAAP